MDIIDTPDLGSTRPHARSYRYAYDTPGSKNTSDQIEFVIRRLSTEGPRANLEKFTGFHTKCRQQHQSHPPPSSTTSRYASFRIRGAEFDFGSYSSQRCPSTQITRNNGFVNPEETVIIGAHQDSQNYASPKLDAPGVKGSSLSLPLPLPTHQRTENTPQTTVQEARIPPRLPPLILTPKGQSSFIGMLLRFAFFLLSFLEVGLLGSQAAAADYERREQDVVAMSQVRYGGVGQLFLVQHWTKNFRQKRGTTEKSIYEDYNHHVHGAEDRTDISDEFSFDHMLEFSKLAVAFAVKLGGWDQDV
ncbi:hypothetical protein V5O48_000211 [Marasmius crinis-equi]|uniref:Uncharacterized protein n=1 Tax=Marasmius crinis-equi TaxID=585013 RepID=A0ABR3G1X0_9AGAR